VSAHNPAGQPSPEYRYRLIRYVPNQISGEFYNVAVVLYDRHGHIVDARFTPDFRRMRCNPAVSVQELTLIRDEFEERRLLGEDFSGYLAQLVEHASNSIQLSAPSAVYCQDPTKEIERVVEHCLATPSGLDEDGGERSRVAGRRLVRMRVTEAFARQGLFRNGHGVQRDVEVRYGASRLSFAFDFQYRRQSKEEHFVHALGLRSAESEAARLSFVLQQYRPLSANDAGLTVVAEDALSDDVRDLLADQGIGAVGLSAIDGYAESIKAELGL
jgi:hypothetical protein